MLVSGKLNSVESKIYEVLKYSEISHEDLMAVISE